MVTFRARALTERDVLKQVERFHAFLLRNSDFGATGEFGERKGISILKFRTTPAFSAKRVEVIFRRAAGQSLPKNETIVTGYLETYPVARELFFLVRGSFHSAGLDDPADGGINTLATFLLVIAFIQKIEASTSSSEACPSKHLESSRSVDGTTCHDLQSTLSELDPQRPAPSLSQYLNPHKLGETFLNLLYFYGHMFDFGANFIRPYVSRFSKSHPFSLKADSGLNSLMILNPFDHNLIITKSFKKTGLLKQTFKLLYNHTFAPCVCSVPPLASLPTSSSRQGNTPAVFTRVACLEEEDVGGSGWAILLSHLDAATLPRISLKRDSSCTDAESSNTARPSKGRSRLSSKSNVFVTPAPPDRPAPEPEPVPAPLAPKLQALFAFNFQ